MILVSFIKLAIVALDTVVLGPVVVAVAMFDQRAAYRVCRLWVWLDLVVCGVRVHTHRLAALDPRSAYVFMSNHESQYAKKELTRLPVFGRALERAGHIIIDRSLPQQAIARLRAARTQMADGLSVMIFPEGTRGTAGQPLLPFKKGGFMLALETGFPIVPLAIRGSGRLLPRGSLSPLRGDIEVIVGPSIPVTGVDRDDLMRRVRSFLAVYIDDAEPRHRAELAADAI